MDIQPTDEERRAIATLHRLANRPPAMAPMETT